jgi:hypothetical protein
MMVTYFNLDERERYSEVEDKELNQIYQEAKKVQDFFIREFHYYVKKGFFSKTEKVTRYSIYGCLDSVQVQCLNFMPDTDSESSINTHVSRAVVFAFCMGLLARRNINVENQTEKDKWEKVDRLEIINHADNIFDKGRLQVFRKENSHFDNIECSFQDEGKTLKIFLVNTPKK